MAAEPRRVETSNQTFRIPDDVVPPPLVSNDQHVVLLNIAHERMSPVSDKPAVRIMGLFQNEAEARSMVPENSNISYYVCPTHKFIPLTSGLDVQPEGVVDAIVNLHSELIASNKRDFEDTVQKQREGEIGRSVQSIRARSERTRLLRTVDFSAATKLVPPVTGERCLFGQTFAVITILNDIRPASLSGEAPLEPLVAVLHATGSLDDARSYAKYTASKAYPNNDLLVVDMYQWLHLEHVDLNQIPEEHANEQLDNMKKRRRAVKNQMKDMQSQPKAESKPTADHKPPDECLQLVEDINKEFQKL